MRSDRSCRTRRPAWLAAVAIAAAALVSGASAGTAPNRLDPNLRNLGAIVPNPRVLNLFWHDDWTDNHPSFTRWGIMGFTNSLESQDLDRWIGGARQYGVQSLTWGGNYGPSWLCGATRAPNSITTAQLIAWVTCMVTVPGTGVPFPSIRAPISNSLYMVYLPSNTTITDTFTLGRITIPVLDRTFGPFTFDRRACRDYGAFHSFGVAATAYYAWGVVPTRCANGSRAAVTRAASHEIIEAITDPFPTLGWIDNSISNTAPGFARLSAGEVADICSVAGAVPTPAATIDGYSVVPYWSNRHGRCITRRDGTG